MTYGCGTADPAVFRYHLFYSRVLEKTEYRITKIEELMSEKINEEDMNSKNFDPESISKVFEEFLNKTTKGLDSEILEWIKQKFESNMPHIIEKSFGDITMEIVVDSSSVINQLNHFATGKSSLLFHLNENPIFPLCAPPLLEKEVLDYIENKAKKKYSKEKLLEGWSVLKTRITIKEIQNDEAVAAATKIMKRDPNDVPFVSLVIDTGASAILSQDNDFTDSVRRFTVSTLGEMVGVYHRGLFSFFIMSDVVPLVIELAGKLVVGIIKILFEFVVIIATLVKAFIKGSVNTLSNIVSKMPNWAIAVLVIVTIAILSLVAMNEKTRKKMILGLKSIWNKTKSTIGKITVWLVKCMKFLLNYLKKMSPYIEMSAVVIADLEKQIELLKKEIENMKLEDVVNYS